MKLYYGEKIKKYRASKELTQEVFASQLGISTSMLRMIELGLRKPNDKVQEEIFNLTGISYSDEIINQIDNEIHELVINYITSNSTFFTPENVTELIHILSALYNTINASNTSIETYLIQDKNDKIEFMAYNLINLLKKYKKNSSYNIKNIFGDDANFIKHCIPIILDILKTSSSIIYQNKEIPLYKGKLPLDIKRNNITELLSENYFSDKSKFAYMLQDDDMFPKYQKGYIAIAIECDEKNTSGDVILSINETAPVLRKISFKDKYVIVEAYNPKIETELFTKAEIRILGQIIEIRFFNNNK